jgi:predicted ester cyclase
MSPEQMKRQARRLAEEVFTQGDLAVVDELIAHDDVDHSSTPPERTSLAVLKDRVTVLRRAFPDLHLIVEADRVVTRSTVRGTHAGEFLGLAPTGRQVLFELIDVNRVDDDGRIAEYWAAVDTHSLLQQLGAPRADSAA